MIFLTILVFLIYTRLQLVSGGSNYIIGARKFVQDEEMLIFDILKSEPSRISTNHTIKFEYPINGLMTCIELSSQSNAKAEIELSYDELLRGSATAINEFRFELEIKIYGFKYNKVPSGFKPLMGKDVVLTGELQPASVELPSPYSDSYDYSEYDIDIDDYFKEMGSRGLNDVLLYEEMKHSQSTEVPSNHSLVFYYIDSTFITFVKVIGILTERPSIKYSHISDRSIKTIVSDYNVLSLSAKFEVYGYPPDNIPATITSRLPGPHIKINSLMGNVMRNLECVEKNSGTNVQYKSNQLHSILLLFLVISLFLI